MAGLGEETEEEEDGDGDGEDDQAGEEGRELEGGGEEKREGDPGENQGQEGFVWCKRRWERAYAPRRPTNARATKRKRDPRKAPGREVVKRMANTPQPPRVGAACLATMRRVMRM